MHQTVSHMEQRIPDLSILVIASCLGKTRTTHGREFCALFHIALRFGSTTLSIKVVETVVTVSTDIMLCLESAKGLIGILVTFLDYSGG